MSTQVRSRAAEVLGVPGDAAADAVAAAFLAGLPAAGLVPPGSTVAALNTLADAALPADGQADLRAEVEDFARRYWSLSPAGRSAAWQALINRCPDEPTAARLLSLRAELYVVTTPQS